VEALSDRPVVLVVEHEGGAPLGSLGDPLLGTGVDLEIWEASYSLRGPGAAFDGLLILGGSANPDGTGGPAPLHLERRLIGDAHRRDVPVLGVCLGAQLAAQALGGATFPAPQREHGWFELELTDEAETDRLLGSLAPRQTVMQWHAYSVDPPPESVILARNDNCVQAFRVGTTWALQFHPEVTEAGLQQHVAGARCELAALGFSADVLLEDTRRHLPAQLELASHVARRFGEVVCEARVGR
jgi:GMP synthase-like glutamine amidotransferase